MAPFPDLIPAATLCNAQFPHDVSCLLLCSEDCKHPKAGTSLCSRLTGSLSPRTPEDTGVETRAELLSPSTSDILGQEFSGKGLVLCVFATSLASTSQKPVAPCPTRVTIKNVSKHCHVSCGTKSPPVESRWVRGTGHSSGRKVVVPVSVIWIKHTKSPPVSAQASAVTRVTRSHRHVQRRQDSFLGPPYQHPTSMPA